MAAVRADVFRRPWTLRVQGRLLLQVAAGSSVIAGVLVFVVAPVQGTFSGSLFDFHVYLAGAQTAAHHGDVYAVFRQQLSNPQLGGFDYPPVVAWLLEPLTRLPERAASVVWIWSMLACTAVGAVVLTKAMLPESWPRLELAALATFAFVPATFNLRLGQLEPVVLLTLILALVAYTRGRQLSCGALIGLAASLKLAPLFLVVLLLRRRWWRAALGSAATMAATVVAGVVALGTGPLIEYVTKVVPAFARQDGWLYNQSLSGLVNRLADHSVLTIQPAIALVTAATLALGVASLTAAALVTRPGARSPSMRGAEFSCAVMAMLLAGSITWYLHYELLLIPLAGLAALLAQRSARESRSLVVALFLCVAATGVAGALLTDAPFVDVLLAKQGTWTWWPLLQLTSLPALGLAFLFVVAVRQTTKTSMLPLRTRELIRGSGGSESGMCLKSTLPSNPKAARWQGQSSR